MMDNERYQAELTVLRSRLPENAYRFVGIGTSSPKAVMAARTNSGNLYTLTIELAHFPDDVPKVFVNKMLYTRGGEPMSGVSATMHTLQSENNRTRICHYGNESWSPRVSIYKVYVKCRLWLEVYELHLRNGKPMDYYLNHQS